jgi:hypothetical protein
MNHGLPPPGGRLVYKPKYFNDIACFAACGTVPVPADNGVHDTIFHPFKPKIALQLGLYSQ